VLRRKTPCILSTYIFLLILDPANYHYARALLVVETFSSMIFGGSDNCYSGSFPKRGSLQTTFYSSEEENPF
jgi:hypothetical protein